MHLTNIGTKASLVLLIISCIGLLLFLKLSGTFGSSDADHSQVDVLSNLHNNKHFTAEKARADWYFNMLRDPSQDAIPEHIREKELQHAALMPKANLGFQKQGIRSSFSWFEAGPTNIGGRTRAFAIDVANPGHLLAGGVSGGVWASTDGGNSWRLVSDPSQTPGVTSIVQDPRVGHQNVWYHASGEFLGNSASDRGRRAFYYGDGLYKSIDNGETWQKLESTLIGNSIAFDSPFDVVNRLAVHPVSGKLIVATNGFGMYASDDQGATFAPFAIQNIDNQPVFTDVSIHENGRVVVSISSESFNADTVQASGIYVSDDEGESWLDITPTTFPERHLRSVMAIAPSNPDIIYIFTRTIYTLSGGEEDVRFHKVDLATNTSEDRSLTMPWDGSGIGYLATQNGYNMAIAVKPDDENFVVAGGVTLFRSEDGFSTLKTNWAEYWIGGYSPEGGLYLNQHPDQHLLVFDRTDPDKLWATHDGGISVSQNILSDTVRWSLKNNNFVVGQYYTVHLPYVAGDTRLVGGMQDNGTTFMHWNNTTPQPADIILGGDGSYAYWGSNYLYLSAQSANIFKMPYDLEQIPDGQQLSSIGAVAPGALFIHPFVIDPNDEETMILPATSSLIRTKRASASGAEPKWTRVFGDGELGNGFVSALKFTQSAPAHRLYFGISSGTERPKLYVLNNASEAIGTGKVLTLPSDIAAGGYVHNIAVNPIDGNELIFALSNYNVESIFYSRDGETFESVEGNLAGDENNPGPSVRSLSIMPTAGGNTYYIAGTSTGLYVTNKLSGNNTVWIREATESVGTTVVEAVDSRWQDGVVAVATHGRGLFVGQLMSFTESAAANFFSLSQSFPNPAVSSTLLPFSLDQSANITLAIYDVTGRRVKTVVENRAYDSGTHQININTVGLANGTYLCRLEASPAYDNSSWFKTQIIHVIQ